MKYMGFSLCCCLLRYSDGTVLTRYWQDCISNVKSSNSKYIILSPVGGFQRSIRAHCS
jgi:hypothetical protein